MTSQTWKVMKLTFILLTVAFLQVGAKGIAQNNVTYSGKKVKLETVFKAIEKQTGFAFFYKIQDLEKTSLVSVELKNTPLDEALTVILKNQPIVFSIDGKTVFISAKPSATSELQPEVTMYQPPPIDVRGRIVNESGEPVAGASIMVKGTNQGTNTNAEGYFELRNVDENAILVISAVNIEPYEVRVNGRKDLATIGVRMKVTSQEEVVVKTNYWETKQRLNSGNISKVNAAEIEKQPVSNPLAALQANVPGLEITQMTGVPGGGFRVRIRGSNSIANGNNPLYVVDGVPYNSVPMSFNETSGSILGGGSATYSEYGSSPLNNINPYDIESIEVLKDADATAIYGSRGANGVILITTKKGKIGKTKLDFNMYSGIGRVARKMDLLNTQQYINMRREAFANDNLTPNTGNAQDLLIWDTTRYTDWQEELIGGTARYSDMQVSISGGEQNTQFLISGGYHKETTVFPGDNSDRRISIHSAITNTSTNKRLRTNLLVSYSATTTNLLSRDLTIYALNLPPNAPALYNQDGSLNFDGWSEGGVNENPVAYTKRPYENRINNLVSNLNLQYNLFGAFEIKANFGYTTIGTDAIQLNPISTFPPSGAAVNTSIFSNSKFQNWIVEPQLHWRQNIYKGILNVLVGSTILQQETDGLAQYAEGYSSESLMKNIAAASTIISATNYYSQYRYAALFGRINYILNEKYILNITGRRDGSSRFGPNNKLANFGAGSAAWIFSNEKLVQHVLPFISFGKLRVSYGTSGNDQIGDYQYMDAYSISGSGIYQTGNGLSPSRLSNPNFSWETNKKFEVGLEFGLFNNVAQFNFSYYRNRSSNQLVGVPLAPTTGFESIQGNFPATVQNKGLEVEINSKNISNKNFSWSSGFNISIPQNTLISFPGIKNFPTYANTFVVGEPLDIFKAYRYLGVDPITGVYQFEDINGDGQLNINDRVIPAFSGSRFFGGLQNDLTYKRLQLSILLQFVQQQRPNHVRLFFDTPGTMFNQPAFVANRWQHSGDITTTQKFATTGPAYNAYYSQLYVSDHSMTNASFIRLKNLSLSWSLPEAWLRKIHSENANIYLRTQNLFTITSYKGLDPEISGASLPSLRVITAGILFTL